MTDFLSVGVGQVNFRLPLVGLVDGQLTAAVVAIFGNDAGDAMWGSVDARHNFIIYYLFSLSFHISHIRIISPLHFFSVSKKRKTSECRIVRVDLKI